MYVAPNCPPSNTNGWMHTQTIHDWYFDCTESRYPLVICYIAIENGH